MTDGRATRTVPLPELADVVRSKNAGPYELTLDIIFTTRAQYELVKRERLVDRRVVAELYGVPVADVGEPIFYDPARAVKINLRRPLPSGAVGETDVYGAQQHGPLLALRLPVPGDAEPAT
ncbi:DUF4387 domain-containing protein [Streptacidiphilus jiangxiensis]|uniref:DUF4387 domain-containing protein n=1 Tax=Streptacidiphilus jiangxiensis TaxID=235985 RepID=A0A1H8BGE9_STRJI|nr:DUF4387 domain-containing protein [Streptacidiphilus jiangxiensis]SEM81945.1 protein of unknown function [Streptacidiphilus jiangxiensis]